MLHHKLLQKHGISLNDIYQLVNLCVMVSRHNPKNSK